MEILELGLRHRIYEIIEVAREGDPYSRFFDMTILSFIVINVCAFVLGTVEEIYQIAPSLFTNIELISVGVFSIEYILRVWCCVENPRFKGPLVGRLRYMFSFMGLVDLVAILPFYLPFITGHYAFFRVIRLVRVFRLFKLARYSKALSSLESVLKNRKEELLSTLFVLFLLLLCVSSLMYYAESHVQPEAFSSIPKAMWWGVATLTTVGYGDVYPITAAGKILGAFVAILGIGLFALPAGIIGASYLDEIENRKKSR